MMGSDARDMMGLPSAAPPKPTPKPSKPKVKGPSGMAREILDLNFEGAPSISIVAPKLKEKPKFPFKPRRWEWTPFSNSARKDDLILRHWRREGEAASTTTGLPVTPADSNAAEEMDTEQRTDLPMQDAVGAKWNAKITRPTYTDEQYEQHLKSDEWSKEETDYLVDLAVDLDLRWVVVGDRYDFQRPAQVEDPAAMEIDRPSSYSNSREVEDLKARYYTVAAKCMTFHTPLSSMDAAEFKVHEQMTKFNAGQEKTRKKHVEKLMYRTQEEANQEDRLLKELQRIVSEQEKLFEDRKALYERLETPRAINPVAAHASTSIYQSSQGLQQLMQSMWQAQKMKNSEQREKRRALGALDTEAAQQAMLESRSQRASLGSVSAISDKRHPQSATQQRQISHSDRAKFGVAYPQERLVSGVQFRHERVVRASQAKSAVQTSRISDALAELGIPLRLVMPTTNVVNAYERVVDSVKTVVEVKKMREKLEGEIKVLKAQRNMVGGEDQVNGEESANDNQAVSTGEHTDEIAPKREAVEDSDEEVEGSKPEMSQQQDESFEHPTQNGHRTDRSEHGKDDGDEDDEHDFSREENTEAGQDGEDSEEADVDQEDDDEDEDQQDHEGRSSVQNEDLDEGSDDDDEDADESATGPRISDSGAQLSDEDEQDASEDDDRVSVAESDEEEQDGAGEPDASNGEDEDEVGEADTAEAVADQSGSPGAPSMRKRSASVISALSSKSSKRQRK